MHPEYNVIRDIIKQYDPENKEVEIESGVLDNDEDRDPELLFNFILSEAEKLVITNKALRAITPDVISGGIAVLKAIKNYVKGYKETFGTLKHLTHGYGFLPKPKDMKLIDMTYLQWLEKYDACNLIPSLIYTTTTQAYGEIDKLPAFYGLMWNRVDLLKRLISVSQLIREAVKDDILQPMLYQGFQHLWEKMVEKDNINVKFNVNIKEINRNLYDERKPIEITFENSNEKMECDVLFSAVDQTILLKLLKNPTDLENNAFGNLKPFSVQTCLCSTDYNDDEKEPLSIHAKLYPTTLLKANGEVYAYRSSIRVTRPELFKKKYLNNNGKKDPEHGITFQFATPPPEMTDEAKQKSAQQVV